MFVNIWRARVLSIIFVLTTAACGLCLCAMRYDTLCETGRLCGCGRLAACCVCVLARMSGPFWFFLSFWFLFSAFAHPTPYTRTLHTPAHAPAMTPAAHAAARPKRKPRVLFHRFLSLSLCLSPSLSSLSYLFCFSAFPHKGSSAEVLYSARK